MMQEAFGVDFFWKNVIICYKGKLKRKIFLLLLGVELEMFPCEYSAVYRFLNSFKI